MKATDPYFDCLDDLAIRARGGDRDAGDAAMRRLEPLLTKVAGQIARHLKLERRYEDILGDVYLGAARALPRFDPGKGRAAVFLEKSARMYAQNEAKGYFSPIGARVARGNRNLDFDEPWARGYTPFGEPDSDGDPIEERLAAYLSSEYGDRQSRYTVNQWIGFRIWRLPADEREVVRRRYGIPPRASSLGHLGPNHRASRLATNRAESYDEIAASLGVSGETVRNILKRALPKLGLDEMPLPVARNRLPIEP